MNRRRFMETFLAGSPATLTVTNGLSAATPAHLTPLASNKLLPVSQLKKRVAIAMWDFSRILRQHRYGGFENRDSRAQDKLTERGYNAIRNDRIL